MASRVQIFDLMPYTIREGDGDNALRTLFDAVQQEYERSRTEVSGLALLIDADGLNTTYQFQAQPTFNFMTAPEKLLIGTITSTSTVQLVTNIAPVSDFYTGYALRILRMGYDADGDGIYEEDQDPAFLPQLANTYTKIIDYSYDSGTGIGTATVYPEFPATAVGLGVNVSFELSMPRYVYLPVTDTLGRSLVTTTDYYRDWYIRIYGGPGGAPIQTRKIATFFVNKDASGNPLSYIVGVDEPFDLPPVATSYVGITPTYVSLNYLAQQVGFEPEATDPEPLQKQQILSAVQAYKLKGTLASFQLLFKAFGFQSKITERFSNYAAAPTDLPGVTESPVHVDTATAANIGTPRLVDEVLTRPLFSDDFSSGTLALWDTASTTGTGTVTVESGRLKITFTNTSGGDLGKRVGYPVNGTQNLGLVLEFDLINSGTIQAGAEFSFLQISNSNRTNAALTFSLYDTTHTLRHNTGGPSVSTGVSIPAAGAKTRLKFRIHDNYLQVYANGTLVYDQYPMGYVVSPPFGTDTSVFLRALPISGATSGTLLFDNVVVSYPDNVLISSGGGENAVTGLAWKDATGQTAGRNTELRIPDSDVTVVLRKLHPDVPFTPDVFQRILKRIEDIRPAHVELALIGSAFDAVEPMRITDRVDRAYKFYESVSVGESLALIPDSLSFAEALGVQDVFLIILADVRWDVTDNRFDGDDEARFDVD